MKNLSLLLLLSCFTITLSAHTPFFFYFIDLSEIYTTTLLNRNFTEAAEYLHPNMDYTLTKEAWIKAQESSINADMSMQTSSLPTDEARTAVIEIGGHPLYHFIIPEQVEATIQNENAKGEPEVAQAILQDFTKQYGQGQVQKTDDQHFTIERNHHLFVFSLKEAPNLWRVVDFPDGSMEMAYGILPAGAWQNLFPGRSLTDRTRYTQAVPQVVGHFYQSLKAKQYDGAETMIEKQENIPARFMKWYKSLDYETTTLAYTDYELTTPVRIKLHEGKRYAGFGLRFRLEVGFKAEAPSEQDIEATKELLEEVHPNSEVHYDETAQLFSLDVYSTTIAMSSPDKNNWKLLLEDRSNGMSINDNIAKEIQQGVGLD